MKEIGVVEVMGQLFNSRSTPTRSNGSKSWNMILLPLFTRHKRERREMEGGRGVCSEEEERSTEAKRFVMRRKRERGRKRELICSEEESLIFCEEERLI